MTRLVSLRNALLVIGLALTMTAVGVLMTRGGPARPSAPLGRAAAPQVQAGTPGTDLPSAIRALQTRLERLPEDDSAWASLGTAYVQQAAVTGDPTYYPKAEGALGRSLRIQPTGNSAALTGQAALAAARHHFPAALVKARAARVINPYSATNHGILSDILVQLGRYDAAFDSLQRMLDLRPGVSSFTRASYVWELRGDTAAAEGALRRALDIASSPAEKAFCYYYLGELAWNTGDLAGADREYSSGLKQDPNYLASLAGRAKVAAARGRSEEAVRLYDDVVQRLPIPTYLIAYADLLRSLGRAEDARTQEQVVRTAEALFRNEGVNVDLETSLFDADHGRPRAALASARRGWQQQRSLEAADAYAWALHANGRDRAALTYARQASRLGLKSALFAYHRGVIESSLPGMRTRAKTSLRRALSTNPHFSPLHAPRAVTLLRDLSR